MTQKKKKTSTAEDFGHYASHPKCRKCAHDREEAKESFERALRNARPRTAEEQRAIEDSWGGHDAYAIMMRG